MLNIRRQTEEMERRFLHPRACLSEKSRGRLRAENEGDLRTCFQRDRDRIIHSKAFRRLKHKTQVFLAPRGDHYRTRLTHVLEVSQIARTVARALRLNEDLTEAASLGHDLGHTPFGHAGEAVLREIHPGGFNHYEQSLRVVDILEEKGKGLNLTHEVRDAIVKHSKGKGHIIIIAKGGSAGKRGEMALTLEGQVVRVSDIIAYLNHDMDDALRAKVIKQSDIPKGIRKTLGERHSKRIDTMVRDLISNTLEAELKELRMSAGVLKAIYALRDFLFKHVYESDTTNHEFRKARKILTDLYEYYLDNIEEVPGKVQKGKRPDKHQRVCDFIAGMTDRFALMTYERLFMPDEWKIL